MALVLWRHHNLLLLPFLCSHVKPKYQFHLYSMEKLALHNLTRHTQPPHTRSQIVDEVKADPKHPQISQHLTY